MTDPQMVKKLTVEAILDKPGLRWRPTERDVVKDWLYENRQLRSLLYIAKRKVSMTPEDAEDALQEFVIRELDYVISMYDPKRSGSSTFLTFVSFCFFRFCVREAVSIQENALVERSLDEGEGETGGALAAIYREEVLNFHSARSSVRSPDKDLYKKEVVDEVCVELSKLSTLNRQIFIMREFEELSYEEIAVALRLPVSTVKVALHRVRARLKSRLIEKGIRP
jgi:RNA polymerase sigma factor (sigma-70 family)